jgi:hypothetical protein
MPMPSVYNHNHNHNHETRKKKGIDLSVPFHFKKPYENSLFISF